MILLPVISQIQSALLVMTLGAILGGVGVGVVVHKLDGAKYDRLVASQATAHSKALADEAKAAAGFAKNIDAANKRAGDLMSQLDAERAKHAGALHTVLINEGKKDAPLAACLARQLPASVLHDLAH